MKNREVINSKSLMKLFSLSLLKFICVIILVSPATTFAADCNSNGTDDSLELDTDADAVIDDCDNCVNDANPNQVDNDGDGYGNICDTDLSNDGKTNFADLAAFKDALDNTQNTSADFNNDGQVNDTDLDHFKLRFGQPPGPSLICPIGFDGDGLSAPSGCSDINECSNGTSNCDANAACSNAPGSFDCACNSGFEGDGTTSGSGCADIDECATNTDNCNINANCTNTLSSFSCACDVGYTGDGTGSCSLIPCSRNIEFEGPACTCERTNMWLRNLESDAVATTVVNPNALPSAVLISPVNSFTFEFWIRTAQTSFHVLNIAGGTEATDPRGLTVRVGCSTDSNASNKRIEVSTTTVLGVKTSHCSTAAIGNDSWTHVAIVYEQSESLLQDGNLTIYFDGIAEQASSFSPLSITANHLAIRGDRARYVGIRFWNVARTQQELDEQRASTVKYHPNLVLNYRGTNYDDSDPSFAVFPNSSSYGRDLDLRVELIGFPNDIRASKGPHSTGYTPSCPTDEFDRICGGVGTCTCGVCSCPPGSTTDYCSSN